MNFDKNQQMKKDRGFTIVELLIVIVIIAVLAAITIVAYNGISARARAAQYQTDAVALLKKAEAYNASTGSYPLTAAGTGGAAITSQSPAGASLTALLNGVTESALPAGINFFGVVSTGTTPTNDQALVGVNAVSNVNSYFVRYCVTGRGMYIFYPDPVGGALKTLTAGVCP